MTIYVGERSTQIKGASHGDEETRQGKNEECSTGVEYRLV
jgi:hypothetical protein